MCPSVLCMTQVPLYFTPREATDFLRDAGLPLTEDTVRRWCRAKQIDHVKLPGGSYRIQRAAIEALIAGESVPAVAA